MKSTTAKTELSRREKQIVDLLHRNGRMSVADVQVGLPDRLTYSGVRSMMRILETKGHIRHIEDGPRYLYEPAVETEVAAKTTLQQILHTFFGGSLERAVAGMLTASDQKLKPEELERLEKLLRESGGDD